MSNTRNGSKRQADELGDTESTQVDDQPTAAAGATAAAGSTATAGTPTASKPGKTKKVKFPCGKCDAEVQCGVSCNSCEIWYHDKCVEGMSKEFFDNCKKQVELNGYSGFLCKICRKMFNVMNKSLKDMKSDLKKMEDRVMVLEQEKEVLAQKVERMERGAEKVTERVEGVEKEMATGMEKAKEEVKLDVRTELAEREVNGNNICIYGLEETKEQDAKKWREGELKKVTEVAGQMGVQLVGEVTIKFRAGREREEGAKPRPLIVKVKDDETRDKFFQNARLLSRVERMRKVFIAQDLTPQQREEDRKAEAARKEDAVKRTEEAKNEGRRERFLVVGVRGNRRVVRRPLEEEAQK